MAVAVVEGIGPANLVPKLDTSVSLSTVQLGAEEGFVLSRIDGRTTLKDICALVPFEAALTEAILKNLWALGLVQIAGATSSKPMPNKTTLDTHAMGATSTKTRRKQKELADPRADGGSGPNVSARAALAAQVAATPTVPVPKKPPPSAEDLVVDETGLTVLQRRRIDAVFSSLGKIDAFRLLEVAQDADKRAIKRAYFVLSKEFHPDRYFNKPVGDFGPKLGEIFKAIKAAFELLDDDERRKAYLESGRRK